MPDVGEIGAAVAADGPPPSPPDAAAETAGQADIAPPPPPLLLPELLSAILGPRAAVEAIGDADDADDWLPVVAVVDVAVIVVAGAPAAVDDRNPRIRDGKTQVNDRGSG